MNKWLGYIGVFIGSTVLASVAISMPILFVLTFFLLWQPWVAVISGMVTVIEWMALIVYLFNAMMEVLTNG